MKRAPVFILALVLSACASVAPVPIRSGDVCFHCRRTIIDTSLAAEVISEQGHAFKFSSVGCLTEYLREHPTEGVRATFVTDHPRGKLIPAEKAAYVQFVTDPIQKSKDFAAFRDKDAAQVFATEHQSTLQSWEAVKAAEVAHSH